ncbi:MAG: ribonuclease Y [Armatimonadota bacterium]|nr:ribonuclease Y [Armatimonadota bacterium]MDR7400724.1 ribonuclease Y [Armatimonadota bacterium]MDR7405137.1 ribonuclease Y [Armatimonadota bacterium]MDR7436465.1 ribonuclease Y [Armatimonadota bacterium]MDR7472500.1 ribonuclease Y [Armatimonadota bacterium]
MLYIALAGFVGFLLGYLLRRYVAEARIRSAEEAARRIIEQASKEAEAKKREVIVEAKDEAFRIKREAEREIREQRAELQRLERRLEQREESLERKSEALEQQQKALAAREQEIARAREEAAALLARHQQELERLSGLTADQAREQLLRQVEEQARSDALKIIKKIETEAREEADRRAREIIALAIQRCAADHTAEVTVSVVPLPNDDLKGRIIGREGRNIRTLEGLTGVDFIIDDTPEAVTLSSFDPIRREIAKIALEKLIADGRIHPARIEEVVEKSQRELDQRIREEGERAAFEAGVHGLHPEEIKLLGRLRFRYSYGQNLLQHSVEVALLAGLMADLLGANAQLARRAGLLHDIGKALTHEVEGTHSAIGVDICRRYHEPPEVLNAISYHHGDEEARCLEAILVAAADAISASRPGARKETAEMYVKRLESLERIAASFPGVDKAYAIQAGREVRVIVRPNEVDDLGAQALARDVARKIEEEMEYPGQIKVTVLRETRVVEYAR